ncbi:GNAT family N-acetyltransferase [Rhodobacter sp. 24-YEA-8]|uniref:GNAT family N-acetyltransferase n=1 Tax=Rhodobacter sp. 24-YEA-8 TaxID=1884310 RepID=UPI00089AC608|nr:GNAT family protein [Rhodobacter sp. 24-YEA-8]SEB64994.1 Protein N-acetyltransferase, RimJ/RimL family [Rhodobacter sp. 24-YEA-8]
MVLHPIDLRLATVSDFAFIRALAQRPENRAFITDEDEAALAAYVSAPDSRLLIAEENGTAIGYALFCEIGDPSGRTELRRLALAVTGGGRGRAFVGQLICYGFDRLQARRLWLDASGENPRAMALYEKLGFRREGVQREHWYRPDVGRNVDLHLFGLLRSDWQEAR